MKRKRLAALGISACLLFGAAASLPHSELIRQTGFAVSAESWNGFEYTVNSSTSDEKNITITAYNGTAKNVTVPEKIDGIFVRRISEGVFKGNTNIESVTIKAPLYYLTQKQFMNCTALKSVTMPDSINWAYYSAFENCTSLESIKLPDELKNIPSTFFKGCTNLSDITFPAKMESISVNAVEGTKWLSDRRNEDPLVVVKDILIDGTAYTKPELVIPSNIKAVGSSAFKGNENLVSVTIPKTVTALSSFVFEDCANLEKAIVNCKTTRIDGLFNRCRKLSEVVLPDGLEVIQNYTFGHCEALKSIKLPSTIKELGFEAFHSCLNLSEINLPEGLEKIGYSAFSNCTKLNQLDLPQSLKEIGETAFKYSGLRELYISAEVEKIGKEAFTITFSDFKILCNKGSYAEKYAKDNNIKYEQLAEYHRYSGSNRYATAAEISKAQFETADTVVIANGQKFADALAGVPLAYQNKAPILLSEKDYLPAATSDEIKRLGAKNVIILGGEGVISKNIELDLGKTVKSVKRISGKNRYATSTAIAAELNKTPKEVFFVYAGDFADALSVSTAAAIKNAPILYLDTNGEVNDATKAYLESVKGKVKKAYVIGGKGVISEEMMKSAASVLGLKAGKTVVRLSGKTRYETCDKVNTTFADILSGTGICVAKGKDFPDALSGGVLAALNKSALMLADNDLKAVQKEYLKSKNPGSISVFGGKGAVPGALVKDIILSAK